MSSHRAWHRATQVETVVSVVIRIATQTPTHATKCGVVLPALALKPLKPITNLFPGLLTGCLTFRIPIYKLALSFWSVNIILLLKYTNLLHRGVASGFQGTFMSYIRHLSLICGSQAICVTITLYKLVRYVQDVGFYLTPMVNIFFRWALTSLCDCVRSHTTRDGALYFLVLVNSPHEWWYAVAHRKTLIQDFR